MEGPRGRGVQGEGEIMEGPRGRGSSGVGHHFYLRVLGITFTHLQCSFSREINVLFDSSARVCSYEPTVLGMALKAGEHTEKLEKNV